MGETLAPLAIAGISGGSNFLSTILTNKSNERNVASTNATNIGISESGIQAQKEENELNRQFNASEAEKSFERQKEMAEYYSPLNISKRLQEAGINPNVFFGGSQSVATQQGQVPQAAGYSSGLSPVMPNITPFNRIAPQIGSDVVDAIQKLSSASRDRADANKTNATLSAYLDTLKSTTEGQQIANSIQQKYGNLLAEKDVQEALHRCLLLQEQAKLAQNQGNLAKERALTEQSEQALKKAQAKLHGEQAYNMELANSTFTAEFRQRMDESRSRAEANRAAARESNASAEGKEILNRVDSILEREGLTYTQKKAQVLSLVAQMKIDRVDAETASNAAEYILQQIQYEAEHTDISKGSYWQDMLKQLLGSAGQAAAFAVAMRFGQSKNIRHISGFRE